MFCYRSAGLLTDDPAVHDEIPTVAEASLLYTKKIWNIPNLLSLIRILLIPIFAYCYLTAETAKEYYVAAFIILLSGLTDMADGIIARHYHMITDFGKIIDPIADKLTQGTVAICLSIRIPAMAVLLSIFIIKEFLMMIGGFRLLRGGAKIDGARWFGKVSTVIFYVVMLITIAFPTLDMTVTTVLICISAAFMIFSFVMYLPIYKELKKTTKDKK